MAGSGVGWPDSGFKLDYAFLISNPFFSGGQFVDNFLAAMGSSHNRYQLAFVGGTEMSVLVTVKWSEMICASGIEVGKMPPYRLSTIVAKF